MARSHYEVLGVAPTAGSDHVRRAYLDRAREAHPDRHVDASGAQRADAERRMQEVNEAWRVLGNPRRRRRYDLERGPEMLFTSRSDGTMPPDYRPDGEVIEEIDSTTRLIRGLPWMILVFVMFAIFVFSAYAATGGSKANPIPSNNLARCVTVRSVAGAGPSATPSPCGTPGARLVVAEVDTNQPCPLGSERLQPATGATVYCLEV
jgi:hypothetical protein